MLAQEREQRILEYYPLVRVIAGRMARRLPPSVEVDELVNIGVLGLIDALDRFEAARGVPLKSFAEIRIHGAMVDFLRGFDLLSRQDRMRVRQLEQVRSRLRRQLGREADRQETAAAMGLPAQTVDSLLARLGASSVLSLDAVDEDEGGASLHEQLADGDPSAEQVWIEEETSEEVTAAIRALPEKERKVVEDIYFRGKPLRAIAVELGVTESRISQLRTQAMGRMQGVLKRGIKGERRRTDVETN